MLIYKILTASQWHDLRRLGETPGAPVDIADGYVHFSTAAQLRETAAKHFAGQDGLWLIALDARAPGPALRWEPSRGGALFPHLYAPLRLDAVVSAAPLARDAQGRHLFPEEIP